MDSSRIQSSAISRGRGGGNGGRGGGDSGGGRRQFRGGGRGGGEGYRDRDSTDFQKDGNTMPVADSAYFGNVSMTKHSKGSEILEGVSKKIRFSQKLRNVSLLSKGFAIATPRFGGKLVYLWVKNKTRVWIDRQNVWTSFTTFPRSFLNGTLLQAEIYRDGDKWIIAFEDVIMSNGEDVSKPFLHRLTLLVTLVNELSLTADPSRDPGSFAVKPWFPVNRLTDGFREMSFRIPPQFLLVRFLPRSPRYLGADNGITQETFTLAISSSSISVDETTEKTGKMVRRIYKIREGDPDQYNLIHPTTGEPSGRACVRTLQCSLWLSGLEDGSLVLCRNVPGHINLEPFADGTEVVC